MSNMAACPGVHDGFRFAVCVPGRRTLACTNLGVRCGWRVKCPVFPRVSTVGIETISH